MKPSIPKGTRDFLPSQVRKRDHIFNIIRMTFVKYGFSPIETPAMEDLKTLTGKYGEEGDQLLFKVLNNGDYLKKADQKALLEKDSKGLVSSISKRGLRYDLTIPFARYVVMHQNDLSFPFKRYQIQPVWRADRPQKGRYQEFYQCDVDIVGSESLMYEAELIQIYDEVFTELDVDVEIRINNRKILFGIAETAGIADSFMDMTVAIDKMDKIGLEGVRTELNKCNIDLNAIEKVIELLNISDLEVLGARMSGTETGRKGIEELNNVYQFLKSSNLSQKLVFDPTLARGLSYYTGMIFEVVASKESYPDLRMGSIGGGGRYADLTSVFGMKEMSGVGISFGAERIYDVMEELNLFPEGLTIDLQVIILSFDEKSHYYGFDLVTKLRKSGILADIYPEAAKMKKQMKYAHDRAIPYIIIIGENERNSGVLTLKNMETGNQQDLEVDGIIEILSSL